MTEKQETNYSRCRDCTSKPAPSVSGSVDIDWFCDLTPADVLAGGWGNNGACPSFQPVDEASNG